MGAGRVWYTGGLRGVLARRVLGAVGVLVAVCVCARGLDAGPGRTWTFGSVSPEGSWYWEAAEDIARALERAVPGLKIKRRFGGVLGDEASTLHMLRQERLELWGGSLGVLADLEPRFGLLELPFAFPDAASLRAGFTRIQRGLKGGLPEAAARRGVAMLHMSLAGWRNLASLAGPIRTAADLRGVRARSQPGRVHRAMWQAFGAVPVETPLNGLSEQLREQKLTALDVPITFLFATSSHEAVRSFTVTRHVPQFAVIAASKSAWAGVPAPQRERARQLFLAAAERKEPQLDQLEEELIGQLARRGAAILRPTAAERQTFIDATRDVASRVGLSAADRPLLRLLQGG